MPFNISECAIPAVWCGNGNPPNRKSEDQVYYHKTGTRYECMKKGFGAGMYSEKKKNLPQDSLQHIKYVGDVFEQKFKLKGINNTKKLRRELSKKTSHEMAAILKGVFTRKGGVVDKRAYNSTVVYLYQHGIGNVPKCMKI